MPITAAEACARANAHQRNGKRVSWVLWILTPFIVAGYIRNLMRFHDPWLITGSLWALAVFGYFIWISVSHRGRPQIPAEPCFDFLRRLLEGKRRWALRMRRIALLCVPAILAVQWGGGPLLRAKSLGFHSPWLLHLLAGPAPVLVMAVPIAAVWFLMTLDARRLDREIRKLTSQ